MMERYIRYEFPIKPDLSHLKEAGHNVVVLSPFVLKEAVINEETGEVIEPAVLSDMIPVDVIYRDAEPDEKLNPYIVTPIIPRHKISGK